MTRIILNLPSGVIYTFVCNNSLTSSPRALTHLHGLTETLQSFSVYGIVRIANRPSEFNCNNLVGGDVSHFICFICRKRQHALAVVYSNERVYTQRYSQRCTKRKHWNRCIVMTYCFPTTAARIVLRKRCSVNAKRYCVQTGNHKVYYNTRSSDRTYSITAIAGHAQARKLL